MTERLSDRYPAYQVATNLDVETAREALQAAAIDDQNSGNGSHHRADWAARYGSRLLNEIAHQRSMSPSGKISEAMVDRALVAYYGGSADDVRHLRSDMRRALTASLSVPTPGTGGAEATCHPCEGTGSLSHGAQCSQCGGKGKWVPSKPQAGDLGAVKVNDRAKEKLKLWFFRDLNDEQRLKLFSLFEMPTDEIGEAHGRQSIALKHVLSALSSSPVGEMVLVPKSALDWLFGEGPDAEGHWFGDGSQPQKGAYWWRSPFRAMISGGGR